MPATIGHVLSATTPDDPVYEIRPSHWNSNHAVTLSVVGSEVIGAFSNSNGFSFGTEAGGGITGSYTVPTQSAFVLSDSNGVSWGTNGSTVTATVKTDYQSAGAYLTTAMASNRGSDFVQAIAAFAGTNASGTINSTGISVSVGNYITTAMASNRGSDFVQATAAFAGTSASGTINSTGISVSIGPYITTARRSTDAIGLNTAQTNVTWTVNSSGVSIDAGGYLTTAMASNRGTDFVQATAAFAGTNASGTINSTGISISVAAPGGGGNPASYFDNLEYIQGSTILSVQGSTSHIVPFMLPYDISISYLRLMVSANFPATSTIATTNAATGSCSIASTIFAVVYIQNTGASSQSLKSIASGSVGFTQRWSLSANATAGSQWTISKTLSFQNTTGATSFTTQSVASTSNINLNSGDMTVMTGMKAMEIPFATSLAASNYWMMIGISSSTATGGSGTLTRLNMSISNIGVSQSGFALGHWGNNTNASVHIMPGLGSFTTNAIGTTASLGYSNISTSAGNNIFWFQFHRTT